MGDLGKPFSKPFKGTWNPFKKGYWSNNNGLLSPSNFGTGGARNLAGSMFKNGGGTALDDTIKPLTPGGKQDVVNQGKEDAAKAASEANAAITAAEYAATAKEGLERLAGKRRRSFASTMIASNNLGSSSVLG